MRKRKKALEPAGVRWALRVTLFSGVISVLLTFLSAQVFQNAGFLPAVAILTAFVFLGVLFDMFGIAAASASETPFHAMASRRVAGAAEGLYFIRNADKVSSLCNDMIGDVCGIVSGAGSAAMAILAVRDFALNDTAVTLVTSGLLVGLTVGGKALGKPVALSHNTQIVMLAGRLVHAFKRVMKKT